MADSVSDFERYKLKREFWIACLAGDDRHSIMNQILPMIWQAAAFRMVNEARRLSPAAPEGGVQLNGTLHSLIDESFFTAQMVSIRRLTDKSGLTGPKGVYSLIGLLDDLMKHWHLITRGHAFAADGRGYDVQRIKANEQEWCHIQEASGAASYRVPQHLDWAIQERRHREWDALAGVEADHRSPCDTLRPELLPHLKKRLLDACQDVGKHVDKFIAHAATPESREQVSSGAAAPTLGHLWDAHRAICQTANFVDVFLLTGTQHGFLAAPQFDQLKYLDRPLASVDTFVQLRHAWEGFDLETERWGSFGIEDLNAEIGEGTANSVPATPEARKFK